MMIADMAAAAKNSRMNASLDGRRGSVAPLRPTLGGQRVAGLIQVKTEQIYSAAGRARLAAVNES